MMTIGEILLHKQTRMVMDKLAKGEPPKVVAAQLAGDLVAEHFAKKLGVTMPERQSGEKKSGPTIIEAEFREIK